MGHVYPYAIIVHALIRSPLVCPFYYILERKGTSFALDSAHMNMTAFVCTRDAPRCSLAYPLTSVWAYAYVRAPTNDEWPARLCSKLKA